jgi:multidrug efflux pump subunit AcrA (membrane-fusion protein)
MNDEAIDPVAWSPRSQIVFVVVAMPVIVALLVVEPYVLSHDVINRHDRFNYIPPPLGGERALEGHWTDPPLATARLIKIDAAQRGFGWIVPNDGLVTRVFPPASGTVEQVSANVGQSVAKEAALISMRAQQKPGTSAGSFPSPAEIVVSAPVAGTVTEIDVAAGDAVKAGPKATPAVLVADLASVWLAGEIDPDLARRVRPDDTVEVRSSALPDKSFKGRVLEVAPVDRERGRVAFRVVIENPDGALKPNMLATFDVPGGAEALVIPQSAVLFENDSGRVFVMERESDAPGASKKLVARSIRIGRYGDGWVEVADGLKPGEEVEATDAVFIDRAARGY